MCYYLCTNSTRFAYHKNCRRVIFFLIIVVSISTTPVIFILSILKDETNRVCQIVFYSIYIITDACSFPPLCCFFLPVLRNRRITFFAEPLRCSRMQSSLRWHFIPFANRYAIALVSKKHGTQLRPFVPFVPGKKQPKAT